MSWNPDLYLTFEAERTRPAAELAARVVVASPGRVIDLGCGPGNSTEVLRKRWPAARVEGLDSDPAMLAAAARTEPAATWTQADAATWTADAAYDVVFSNATLHWLPDHAAVVPRLFRAVRPGGALAVQLPAHPGSPIQPDIRAVADDPRWRTATAAARAAIESHDPGYYYDALAGIAARIDLWVTEYYHPLGGPDDILNWIRGTGLRPFLAALPESDRAAFEAAVRARLAAQYPRRADGRVVFPFRRLFFVAYRADDEPHDRPRG